MTGALFLQTEGRPLCRPKKYGTRRSSSLQLVESRFTEKRLQDFLQQFGQAPAGFVQFVADYMR